MGRLATAGPWSKPCARPAGRASRFVATLGKEPEHESRARHGWEAVADWLEGRAPAVQGPPGQRLAETPRPQWAQGDLRGVRGERVRDFGPVCLALSLWRRLGRHTLLRELMEPGAEHVPWERTACLLTLSRFCGQKSEREVAERGDADSALEALLGVPFSRINDARLYRRLDVLLAQKDRLCAHLHERSRSWFGVEFEFLSYDVTSTYFEGKAEGNVKAGHGSSRLCARANARGGPTANKSTSALGVTPEGLPIGFEVFAGHTAEAATVEERVEAMEKKHGVARRLRVLDRGMIREENIDFLREKGARHLVGTPQKPLQAFEAARLEASGWTEVPPGVEGKLVAPPDGAGGEQYVLGRSSARREKELARLEPQRERLRAPLDRPPARLARRPAKDAGKIERRIGRWLGRFPAAERPG